MIREAEASTVRQRLISHNIANIDVAIFNFHHSCMAASVEVKHVPDRVTADDWTRFDGTANTTYRVQDRGFLMAGGSATLRAQLSRGYQRSRTGSNESAAEAFRNVFAPQSGGKGPQTCICSERNLCRRRWQTMKAPKGGTAWIKGYLRRARESGPRSCMTVEFCVCPTPQYQEDPRVTHKPTVRFSRNMLEVCCKFSLPFC